MGDSWGSGMSRANKKCKEDGGEVMQRVVSAVEGLEMRPKLAPYIFGKCSHDHLLFAMIRSLFKACPAGYRKLRRWLRCGHYTA